MQVLPKMESFEVYQGSQSPRDGARPSCAKDVDVVIPVYNGSAFIVGCVLSVLTQTHQPKRVIVVDDGSTDETAALVQSLMPQYPQLVLHQLERNRGLPAARNAGVKLCRSEFVGFLDADDIWAPNKLELQLEVFGSTSESVGLVHSAYFLIDEDGERQNGAKVHEPKLRGEIFRPLLTEGYALSGSASSALVRREVLERTGEFDEKLTYAEDLDLWLRLSRIAHVDFTPEAVVGIRVHPNSIQRRREPGKEMRFLVQRLRIYGKWEDQFSDNRDFVRGLRREVFDLLLGEGRSLAQVEVLFAALKNSDKPFVRRLFPSRIDLWWGLSLRVVERLWKKAGRDWRRLIGARA